MKDNKSRLFEMMSKVTGMKLNEDFESSPINGENDNNMGDTHLVDDLYASDFIGKKMKYGSPGYPMTFIPREITEKGNGEFEFTGDMPGATIGTEGHYFTISENELEELELNGEVSWIGPDGAHLYLSF